MTGQRFANVWDAIENTPAEAENMKIRSKMMIAITAYIERTGITQAEAANLFEVTQPRISDLMRGKIAKFSLDSLVNMLVAAGIPFRFEIEERVAQAA
jgi:predicted XRE-type DNA-binding protein